MVVGNISVNDLQGGKGKVVGEGGVIVGGGKSSITMRE
jgi:hypothetical protein